MSNSFEEKLLRNALFLIILLVFVPSIIFFGYVQNFKAMYGLIFFSIVSLAYSMPGILKFIKVGKLFEARFNELKNAVDPIIAKETEPEVEPTVVGTQGTASGHATVSGQASKKFTAFESVVTQAGPVIIALGNSNYSRRTVGGIEAETKLHQSEVIAELKELEKAGLVHQSGSDNQFWGLTALGRSAFHVILKSVSDSPDGN